MSRERTTKRDPQITQAWLIGSGIASLSAAVHLIRDANVPASNIHFLDVHAGTGGGIRGCGSAENGYFLYSGGCLPYFHDRCVEELLALVPSPEDSKKSVLDGIKESGTESGTALTRLLEKGEHGPRRFDSSNLQIGPGYRWNLMKVMSEGEKGLEGRIEDHFDKAFFETTFWTLWSTTFALQPWHSVLEFRRLLRKHLADIEKLNNPRPIDRTKYTIYESIIQPITQYLKSEGVNFKFGTKVVKLEMDQDAAQPTIAKIVTRDENDVEKAIMTTPDDLVMVTIGSTNSGSEMGSDLEAPATVSSDPSTWLGNDWGLWDDLKKQGPGFGDAYHFTNDPEHTMLETFTVTLRGSDFLEKYQHATGDKPGVGALLSFRDSKWGLSISVPQQPVCANQPSDVAIIWGYALRPNETGDFVNKPMTRCSGREIFTEVLSHLNFPLEELLPQSKTIPCVMPLGTAPLMTRKADDRPNIIPNKSANLVLLGQYVEIPEDTTLSMEYSVRGAQTAVCCAMGLPKHPPKIRTHLLLNVLDLLGGV